MATFTTNLCVPRPRKAFNLCTDGNPLFERKNGNIYSTRFGTAPTLSDWDLKDFQAAAGELLDTATLTNLSACLFWPPFIAFLPEHKPESGLSHLNLFLKCLNCRNIYKMLTSGIRRGLKYQSSKSPSAQDLFHPQEETHCVLNNFV